MITLLAKTHIQAWQNFQDRADPEGELWGYEYRDAMNAALALEGARYTVANPSGLVLLEFDRDADATMFVLKWS